MKKVLGLRYRKIRRQPIQSNSERCLVQRQQYAQRMLDVLASGKRVLNVDESWLSDSEYSRRMWYPTSPDANLLDKPLSQRHSLIVALDTEGRIYFALYHVNTDSDMMALFFYYLAQQLDSEDVDWRENTVLLLDNAPYHASDETKATLHRLGFVTIFSGPYSYSAAPASWPLPH